MKTSPYLLLTVNAILAVGLTVLSFQYIQPKNCYNFCDPSYLLRCGPCIPRAAPLAEETYPVHRKTRIERIIFYDVQDVMALDGHPIGDEKTVWTGYGDYRP